MSRLTIEEFDNWYWIVFQANQKGQELGYFYIVKFEDKDESFFKFWITSNSIKRRFGDSFKYNVKIIRLIKDTNLNCALLEKKFSESVKDFKYVPQKHFCGWTECFKVKNIIDFLTFSSGG